MGYKKVINVTWMTGNNLPSEVDLPEDTADYREHESNIESVHKYLEKKYGHSARDFDFE